MSAMCSYDDLIQELSPILMPALADLICSALGAADDPTLWADRLRLSATTFIQTVREAPHIIFRPARPDDAPCSSCDWGDCNRKSVAWRWSDQTWEWLPVCRKHRTETT